MRIAVYNVHKADMFLHPGLVFWMYTQLLTVITSKTLDAFDIFKRHKSNKTAILAPTESLSFPYCCSVEFVSVLILHYLNESRATFLCYFQDGTERNIETISLIDAVLPDAIEQRKQGAIKGPQAKADVPGAAGEEGKATPL